MALFLWVFGQVDSHAISNPKQDWWSLFLFFKKLFGRQKKKKKVFKNWSYWVKNLTKLIWRELTCEGIETLSASLWVSRCVIKSKILELYLWITAEFPVGWLKLWLNESPTVELLSLSKVPCNSSDVCCCLISSGIFCWQVSTTKVGQTGDQTSLGTGILLTMVLTGILLVRILF